MSRIGIALSGGGHRATIWGAGVLLYLADAGRQSDVGVIASVSGGSILNGVVAHEMDYAQTGPADLRIKLRHLLNHVAFTGLFFWGPSTNKYVLSVFTLAGLGAIAFLAGLGLAFWHGAGVLSGSILIGALIVLSVAVVVFGQRSRVVDGALAKTHFTRGGHRTKLAGVGERSLDHVMCSTELQSGEHFYFAPGFLCSYAFGCGEPADMNLSTAVQASACFPGAFNARRLPTHGHSFVRNPSVITPAAIPPQMLLTDGGVYDNMGDQWLDGLAGRLRDNPALAVKAPALDEAIVVNSSARKPWTEVRASWLPLRNELATLGRVKDVQYAVSTSTRRHSLIAGWDAAAASGSGTQGALINIAQSPFEVPDAYLPAGTRWPQRAQRAAEALAWLGDTPEARASWAEVAKANSGIPTVLRKLGLAETTRLLWHSYVLTACNLHVILDSFPLPPVLPTKEDFAALIGEARETYTAQ